VDQKRVEFPCGQITLEGVLSFPDGDGPFPFVAICHPHPLYGGSMNNNVVQAVESGLLGKGMGSLIFNFRGVGGSGGRFGGGIAEHEDLKAALSFAATQKRVDPGKMGACGYSFGSLVAFSAAVTDERVKAVAGVSPFVEPADLLDHYAQPKLFICGTEDGFIASQSLRQLVQRLPEPKELVLVPEVDHFWVGHEDDLAEKVTSFFLKFLKE
jgi:alpha/beta superfamily hydrolase